MNAGMNAGKKTREAATPVADAVKAIGASLARAREKTKHPAKASAGGPPKARDRLMPLMELARHWGWSRSKLWRLVKRGEIPHLVIGPRRDVHFRESQVEAWLSAQTRGATPAPPPPTNTGRSRREEKIWLGLDPDEENPFE